MRQFFHHMNNSSEFFRVRDIVRLEARHNPKKRADGFRYFAVLEDRDLEISEHEYRSISGFFSEHYTQVVPVNDKVYIQNISVGAGSIWIEEVVCWGVTSGGLVLPLGMRDANSGIVGMSSLIDVAGEGNYQLVRVVDDNVVIVYGSESYDAAYDKLKSRAVATAMSMWDAGKGEELTNIVLDVLLIDDKMFVSIKGRIAEGLSKDFNTHTGVIDSLIYVLESNRPSIDLSKLFSYSPASSSSPDV